MKRTPACGPRECSREPLIKSRMEDLIRGSLGFGPAIMPHPPDKGNRHAIVDWIG